MPQAMPGSSQDSLYSALDPTLYSYLTTIGELLFKGMIAIAPDGSPALINSAGRMLLGLDPAMDAAAAAAGFQARLRNADGTFLAAGQSPAERLVRGDAIDGDEIYYQGAEDRLQCLYLSGAALRDGQGRLQAILLLFHDTLVEKMASRDDGDLRSHIDALKRQMARQSAQVEAVIASIPDGIAIADSAGNLLQINEIGQHILGGSPRLRLSENIDHYLVRTLDGVPMPPDDLPLARALRGERVAGFEHLVHGSSGSETRVNASANPIYSQDGSIIGAVATFRDVTRQRRDEEERAQRLLDLEGLREIAQATGLAHDERAIYGALVVRLARLLHGERCALLLFDETRNVLHAQEPSYGLSVEHASNCWLSLETYEQLVEDADLDRPLLIDVRDVAPESPQAALLQAFAVRNLLMARLVMRDRLIGLIVVCDKIGDRRFDESDMRLLQTVTPQAALAITNSRLYTRALRSNAETQVRARDLARANAELDAFTYSVSHDLRAPLRAIKGFTQILERDLPDLSDRSRHQFARIRANVDKMSNLIEDLLAFSRAGRRVPEQQAVDTNALVREALRLYGQDLAACGAHVHIETLPPVYGDSQLLEQVFANLISNAIKYRRPEEPLQVQISGSAHAGHTALVVRDNGIGFDMRYHDKLFEVFQRLHGDAYEGTGIGLALVRKIIERHGGRIYAESAPGAGATFFIELPTPDSTREDQHAGTEA